MIPVRFAWAASLLAVAAGCGQQAAVTETSAQAATRIYAVAERLQQEQKSRQAFAAYRQIVEQFPASPEARKAADRIARSQQQATTKRRAPAR